MHGHGANRGRQGLGALQPFSPSSIFTRDITAAALAGDQTFAHRIANQFSYANKSYSYNGEAPPKFFGYSGEGYGGNAEGNQAVINLKSFSPALFVVPAGQATQKVTYVNSSKEPQAPGAAGNLQSYCEAVPMPTLSKIPSGVVTAEGTDKHCIVWQPSTGRMWEFWKLEGTEGAWTFQYGGYIGADSPGSGFKRVGEWNGIFLPVEGATWGARACGLACFGGVITIQDIVEALQGKAIGHALGVNLPVTENATRPPADRHDSQSHTPEKLADNITANPAFGFVDQVPEAAWFRFHPESRAAEFAALKGKLIPEALYEAARKYGVFVNDSSATASFQLQSPVHYASPYAWERVNPFAGTTSGSAAYAYANSLATEAMTDATLPVVTQPPSGTTSLVFGLPVKELQLIEAFSS